MGMGDIFDEGEVILDNLRSGFRAVGFGRVSI